MRRTSRPRAIAALLLASAAALAGCARAGDYERTPPSRYAGTWQDRAGREFPDDRPSSEGSRCCPTTAPDTATPSR